MTKRQKQYLGWLAACVAITAIVLFVLLSWSTNYNYCVGHSGAHDTGQYDQYGHAIFTTSIDNPSAIHLFAHCFGVFTDQHAAALSAISTVLLMMITAGLVILGWMQYGTTRTQLRAYVAVEIVSISDGAPAFQSWPYCTMVVKNSGETPAKNVRNWTKLDVGPINGPILSPLVIAPVAGSNITSGGTTHYNNLWMLRQLAANEISAIQAGTQAVYVYGHIKYVDVFDRERETNYRLMHTGSWPPLPGGLLYFAVEGNTFT